ncbi:MAG TPA: hypothetical protein DEP45_14045 [Armatimonadetes bacterium]|nr:hypothetical protein [Armatimonadota bacterium]
MTVMRRSGLAALIMLAISAALCIGGCGGASGGCPPDIYLDMNGNVINSCDNGDPGRAELAPN